MSEYLIVFYNRFACQTQVVRYKAENKFRAARQFYREHPIKQYRERIECIEKL